MSQTRRARWIGLCGAGALSLVVACGTDDDTGNAENNGTAQQDGGTPEGASQTEDAAEALPTIVELAAGDDRFESLVAAVQKAGLVDALNAAGPLTVFAPTDDAFETALSTLGVTLDDLSAEQLAPILTYHVIEGAIRSTDLAGGPVTMLSGITAFVSTEGGAGLNDANVVIADLEASNGVVHVIDKVILPPNLVEAATLAGSFTTLLSAAGSADLVDTLGAEGADLTVFAPTDAAFSELTELPTGDDLKNVLLYHVVAGKVLSSDLADGSVPSLWTGQSLTVDLSDGVRINQAVVGPADIVTTNGVIHVIDSVLLPGD